MLQPERQQRLNDIVGQMQQNYETEDDIRLRVDAFTRKYDRPDYSQITVPPVAESVESPLPVDAAGGDGFKFQPQSQPESLLQPQHQNRLNEIVTQMRANGETEDDDVVSR